MVTNIGISVLVKDKGNNLVIELGLIHHDLTHRTIFCIICITVICNNSSIIRHIASFSSTEHGEHIKIFTCGLVISTGKSFEGLVLIINTDSCNIFISVTKICFYIFHTSQNFICLEVFIRKVCNVCKCLTVLFLQGSIKVRCGLNGCGKGCVHFRCLCNDCGKVTFCGSGIINDSLQLGLCSIGSTDG